MSHILFGLSLLVGIVVLVLGIIAYRADKKAKNNQIFLILTLAVIVWIGAVVFRFFSDFDTLVLWGARLSFAAALMVVVFFYNFTRGFPTQTEKFGSVPFLINASIALFAIVALFTDLVVESIEIVSDVQRDTYGLLYPLFAVAVIIVFLLGVYNLLAKFKSLTKNQKTQTYLVLVGFCVSVFLVLVTNIFIPSLTGQTSWAAFSPLFVVFFIGFTAYAIVKHGLFNIRIIATQIVTFGIWVFLFTQTLLSETWTLRIANAVLLILTIVFGIFLIRNISTEISQREELQKLAGKLRQTNTDLLIRNRYLSAFQSLTNEITRTLDYKKVTQNIVDSFSEKLGFVGGLLLMLDKNGETVRVEAITQTPTIKRALKMLPKSVFDYESNFKTDQDLSALAIRTGRTQIGTDLYAFIGPPAPKGAVKLIQNLLRIRTILAVPIVVEDKPVGCLMVVMRRPKAEVTEMEVQMIQALADEVGIITRNLHLYEALEAANDKLKVANAELAKLDRAKTEFLSVASHQLRTPLTAIKGYASMMLGDDYGKLPDKMKVPIVDIHESADRLINLVNDLLDVSRIASGRLELHITAVDLVATGRDIIKELKPKAEDKKTKVFLKPAGEEDYFVKADTDKLRQVIVNLVDNGIKYSANGQVTISIERAEGDRVRFSVADTGIGLSAEELQSLFQRFVRTKEAQLVQTEGTGLGLYVAKNIIDALGGKIWAESDGLGKGSRFIFELPRASSTVTEEVVKVVPRHEHIV